MPFKVLQYNIRLEVIIMQPIIEAGKRIGEIIKFVVTLVEEVLIKPKSGAEKKAAAVSILKQWIQDVIDQLPLSDFWKKVLKTVLNWDFVLGMLIDRAVAQLNEMGIFSKSEGK